MIKVGPLAHLLYMLRTRNCGSGLWESGSLAVASLAVLVGQDLHFPQISIFFSHFSPTPKGPGYATVWIGVPCGKPHYQVDSHIAHNVLQAWYLNQKYYLGLVLVVFSPSLLLGWPDTGLKILNRIKIENVKIAIEEKKSRSTKSIALQKI